MGEGWLSHLWVCRTLLVSFGHKCCPDTMIWVVVVAVFYGVYSVIRMTFVFLDK